MEHDRVVRRLRAYQSVRLDSCTMPVVVALALFLMGQNGTAENWIQFRGNQSNGEAASAVPTTWSETENVRWRIDIAGEGWSCPVVWKDSVIVTSAVPMQVDQDDSFGPEPYSGGGGRQRSDLTSVDYRWEVICLDARNGSVRWRQTARTGKPPIPRHSSNTFATETPITDGERIYAYFGMTGVYCYNLAGELQWQKDLGTFPMRAGWGTSSSPVLYRDKLIIQVDNEERSFVVALSAATGEEVWRQDRAEPSQYSSPIIWRNSERDELILGGQFYRAYDPNSGALLWQLDMEKGRSSATPLAVGDRLFVGTEFRNRGGADDGGGYLFALRPGGSGQLSAEAAGDASAIVWKLPDSGIQMASPVLCQGFLYLLERRSGILHCVNAETGEKVYRRRIPGARAFWASPWTHDGKVFCLDDSGTTYVLAGGESFQVIAKNVIDEQAWSSPAVANGSLYLRTAQHLYCISEDASR